MAFPYSSDVVVDADIVIADHNNLRKDVLDASDGHDHSGAANHGKKIPKLWLDNDGLQVADTNASHYLIIKPGSNITADRILTITTGDAARTLTLNGNPTLDDWFNQSVKTTGKPTHAGIILTNDSSIAATKFFSFDGDGGDTGISADASNNLAHWTAGSIKLYIAAGGDVSLLAGKKMLFDGNAGHTFIYESGDGLFDFYANATHLLRLSTGGILIGLTGSASSTDVTYNTGTNAFTYVTSSLRYKKNITPIESMLNRVLQLKPSRYDFKDGSVKNEFGLIAEEVYPLFPEVVPLDKDGQPESVCYSRLSVILLKAIQELKGELDELKRAA